MLEQSLHKKPGESVATLRTVQEAERLKLAVVGSGAVAFDWTVADDHITWEGALDALPPQITAGHGSLGRQFLAAMDSEGRRRLTELINIRGRDTDTFEVEAELSSPMGMVFFLILGTRIADAHGATERLTGLLREFTERRHQVNRLTYLATRDELTGHLNRNSLRAELAEAIAAAQKQEHHCGFLVASIDRLAMINDSYGFDAADEVIVGVGERLNSSLRSSDIIGRTAGNKFGVVLKNCTEEDITSVAERLRAVVRDEVVDTKSGKVAVTSSVGAVWLPGSASSSQEAMLRAEEALERARSKGRDGFCIYHRSQLREGARVRLMHVADEVISALKEDRLIFAYQPIIDAITRETVEYECLLRMIRPDGTVAPAGHFIPAAEQLGLVRLVDRRALEMAIATLEAHPKVHLSVNVSGTTAQDSAFLSAFVEYVREHSAVARRLVVELTETAALHHFEENAQFVSRLREMGCRVAIDDFGAGYTSFRNLQMLRVDKVKIDGSYVAELSTSPENQVFVRTLVDLAKNFNLKTTAEWVGTEEEAQMLAGFGVDYFQGFFFGQPLLRPDWP